MSPAVSRARPKGCPSSAEVAGRLLLLLLLELMNESESFFVPAMVEIMPKWFTFRIRPPLNSAIKSAPNSSVIMFKGLLRVPLVAEYPSETRFKDVVEPAKV